MERFVLSFDSVVVGPSERVSGFTNDTSCQCQRSRLDYMKTVLTDETSQNIVTPEYTNDSQREESQSNSIRQETLMVNQLTPMRLFESLASDPTDEGTDSASEEDLIQPSRDDPMLEGFTDRTVPGSLHEEDRDEQEWVTIEGGERGRTTMISLGRKTDQSNRGGRAYPSPSFAPLSAEMMSRTSFGTCFSA